MLACEKAVHPVLEVLSGSTWAGFKEALAKMHVGDVGFLEMFLESVLFHIWKNF